MHNNFINIHFHGFSTVIIILINIYIYTPHLFADYVFYICIIKRGEIPPNSGHVTRGPVRTKRFTFLSLRNVLSSMYILFSLVTS